MHYWHFNKGKDTVTSFYLDPADFDKWMQQNKAEFTGDYVTGVLQDSFVVATKRGYAFFYEHYLNEWSSDYAVYFISYKSGEKHLKAYDRLWADWLQFAAENAETEVA